MSDLQIEEGKYYRRADGSIHGPARPNGEDSNPRYPWSVGNCIYTDSGGFYYDQESPTLDLVAGAPQLRSDMSVGVAAATAHEAERIGAMATDIKTTIADEAKRIVSGARRSAYGKPEDNFERIARLWQAHFANTGRPLANVTAGDISVLMVLMKVGRIAESPAHYDSWLDIVGYALTGAEVNGVTKPA